MDRSTDCWLWKSKPTGSGYGNYQPRRGINLATHKLAYELICGSSGHLLVLHTCDNKLCCNPEHLFLGSQQVNMDDKVSKNRQAKGHSHGMAKLTDEQIEKVKGMLPVFTNTEIHNLTGIPMTTISKFRLGKHWSDK